jgi:hypothetical protein
MTYKARFRYVWKGLAAQGLCDDVNSVEFRRTLDVWLAKGCPAPIRGWVLWYLTTGRPTPDHVFLPPEKEIPHASTNGRATPQSSGESHPG